ncbi:hypothetical protein HMSSN139_49860 [Paenibacillus sp. HMSSN-139]|nr:hypothetical protein HMSSN139_49860 [Paenibacillus sp. HMSSN-139]
MGENIDQNRPAVATMHQIAEPNRSAGDAPGPKSMKKQNIRPLATGVVEIAFCGKLA